MEQKFFLVQIKRTEGTYTKGVVVHDTQDAALNAYHAYFGAYGYGKDANTDYVQCAVMTMDGRVVRSEVDNRIPEEEETTNE